MGDDDVICLSSDDEVAWNELPIKKPKIDDALIIAKVEPKDNEKTAVASCPKRKNSDDSTEFDKNLTKRSKIDCDGIDEIIIESPSKEANGTVGAVADAPRLTIRKDVLKNGNMFLEVDNTVEVDETSESRYSKNVSEGLPSRVLNPVARLKEASIAKSSASTSSNDEQNITKSQVGELATIANGATSVVDLQGDMSDLVPTTVADNENANLTSSKADEDESTSSVASSKVKDIADNPTCSSASNAAENVGDRTDDAKKKSADSQPVRETSDSPELLIIGSPNTENCSETASVDASVEVHSAEPVKCVSEPEATIVQDNEKSITTDEVRNNDSHTKTDSIGTVVKSKTSSSLLATKDSDATKSSPKTDAKVNAIRTKNDETERKRITPKKLSDSSNNSNRSRSEVSEGSKNFKDPLPHNRKKSDPKVATEEQRTTPKASKNSRLGKDSRSKDSEPLAGCSKSLDDESEKSSTLQSSSKRKSLRSKNVERTEENIEGASRSSDSNPQPSCSTTITSKPCLIVMQKKPVLHNDDQDTFSMFLSLCLQTDRCADMERIVAKLKNYYEQLNPEYAASEAFRDTLNEKRELIMRKGKKVVYHYVQLLQKDMKARRKKSSASRSNDTASAVNADGGTGGSHRAEEEDDDDEARRKRHKIKRIEKAMKECQSMIKKYEEAEIDFDDENNSHYIKLDRFKQRMVELWTQMCKYTDDHPDAGRSYLRPKHLRVTQIPSIDQAINSFINSKLSFNNRRLAKGKSFVDGLIFPDYVDILECVEKVNKEQKLKLDKRAMNNMAEKAFTQLGKHLQEARQNDYWDTFSLNLENNVDPAASDADLSSKLSENKKIAAVNEKKVFDEFVKKQEERKYDDKDESPSDGEDDDEDDEDAEDDDDLPETDKKFDTDADDTNDDDDCDIDRGSDDENPDVKKKPMKTINEAIEDEDEENAKEDDAKNTKKKKNSDETTKDPNGSSSIASSTKKSLGKESATIEVILDDVDTVEVDNIPMKEEFVQQPLRLRSFAKQPESWQSSQEPNEETINVNPPVNEQLESTEDEITVVSYLPARDKHVDNKIDNERILNLRSRSSKVVVKTPGIDNSGYPTSVPLPINETNQNSQIVCLSRPEISLISRRPCTVKPILIKTRETRSSNRQGNVVATGGSTTTSGTRSGQPIQGKIGSQPIATSTPVQRPQLSSNRIYTIQSRLPLQPPNQLMGPCVEVGKIVAGSYPSRSATAEQRSKLPGDPSAVKYQIQVVRGGLPGSGNNIVTRTNQPPPNKVAIPHVTTGGQSTQMQLMRTSNGRYVTVPVSSLRNSANNQDRQKFVQNDFQQRK